MCIYSSIYTTNYLTNSFFLEAQIEILQCVLGSAVMKYKDISDSVENVVLMFNASLNLLGELGLNIKIFFLYLCG